MGGGGIPFITPVVEEVQQTISNPVGKIKEKAKDQFSNVSSLGGIITAPTNIPGIDVLDESILGGFIGAQRSKAKEKINEAGNAVVDATLKPVGDALGDVVTNLVAPFVAGKTGLGALSETGRGFTIEDIAALNLATDVSATVKKSSDVLRPEQQTKTSFLGTPEFANITEEGVDQLFGTFLARQDFLQKKRQQQKFK